MVRNILLATLLLLAASAAAAGRQLPEPKLTPTPSTEEQTRLIRQGVALHGQGRFDDAIRKYEEVLASTTCPTSSR